MPAESLQLMPDYCSQSQIFQNEAMQHAPTPQLQQSRAPAQQYWYAN
jgi:hypothetical protein